MGNVAQNLPDHTICSLAYQICSSHLSKRQTSWTDQNMVLLFIDTYLRQKEDIIIQSGLHKNK